MNYFYNKEKQRQEKEIYWKDKSNLRLKYFALSSISISIILLLIMAFGLDYISPEMVMFIEGCVGLFAIIFVILVAILVYRVNVAHLKDRITGRFK